MNLPENFCVAPFIQHTTHPSGSCSPCPYLGGTTWPASSLNIMEQWNDPKLEALRQDFLDNKKSEICNRCWNEEASNKKSLRLRLLDPVAKTSDYGLALGTLAVQRLRNDNYKSGPLVLTIKNGNLCNAKCRVCHPNDSSRWIEDSEKLHKLLGKRYYNLNSEETNWSESQADEIVQLSQTLFRLELFGGEPTYNKKVINILQRIVDAGEAKHITLYINTNGSVDIAKKIPFATEFKRVEIGVSIDGANEHFDYIRHGLDYGQVVKNVQSMREFFAKTETPLWIRSISTVNILNIYYLPELKAEIQKMLDIPTFWNLLVEPEHLYIKNMPPAVKQDVIQKLGNDQDFQELISVMQQSDEPEYWDQFLEITQGLDTIRKENFKETFPEFAKLIFN